jgi:hypothetical protein
VSGLLKAALLVFGLLAVAGVVGLTLAAPGLRLDSQGQGDLRTTTGEAAPAGAKIPAMDAAAPTEIETATFAMG